jgi:hypothetical protein
MDDLSTENLDARIEEAIFRTARVKAFLSRFPLSEPSPNEILPPISWSQIERQLRSLAAADFERASWELEVLKATARTSPPEMFYRELMMLAWSLIDDTRPLARTEPPMD